MRLDAPFDYYTMTAVPDGDFPGALRQEALAWMPADVVRDFGNVGSSMVSGEILYLDSKDTEAIVQRLKRAGFRCRRDQDLVGPLL